MTCVMLLLIMNFLLLVAFIDLSRGYRKTLEAQHTYCVSAISEFVSDRLIAQSLRTMAEKWDNVETQPLLTTLAREKYEPGGPGMPAIWLRYEADRIDPKPEQHDYIACPYEHTYEGRCIGRD